MKRTRILGALAMVSASLLCAGTAFADAYGLDAAANQAGLPKGDVNTYTGTVIGAALALSGTIFLALMIYSGILYMTSSGDIEKVKKAKSIIRDSVIGVVLIGLAYAILNFVFSFVAPK